jgi:hypothetical protein
MKIFQKVHLVLVCIGLLSLASCKKKEDEKPALNIPATYNFADFEANTTDNRKVANDLVNLTNYMKKARASSYTLEIDTLNKYFTHGGTEPSLSGLCTPYYRNLIQTYFQEIVASSGKNWSPNSVSETGGVFVTGSSAYLFDENGVEMEQLIEKGLFGAVNFKNVADNFLNHGHHSSDKTQKEAAIDKALVHYGAPLNFPNGKPAPGQPTDIFHAQYAARRNNLGFYDVLKTNFLRARAAVSAGDAFKIEVDPAVNALKVNWEKAIAATVVNYIHSTSDHFSKTNPEDNDIAVGLHAWGECIGFLHGLKTITNKKIADAQIDEALVKLNFPLNGTPNPLDLRSPTELAEMRSVFSTFKSIYGFSDADIEAMKINDINNR